MSRLRSICRIVLVISFLSSPSVCQTVADNRATSTITLPDFRYVIPPRQPDWQLITVLPHEQQPVVGAHRHGLGKLYWLGWGSASAFSVADVEMVKSCEHIVGCEYSGIWGRDPNRLTLYVPRVGMIAFGMLMTAHWLHKNPQDKTSKFLIISTDSIWGASTAWDAANISRK